jgi:hypothetical protein
MDIESLVQEPPNWRKEDFPKKNFVIGPMAIDPSVATNSVTQRILDSAINLSVKEVAGISYPVRKLLEEKNN